MENIQTQRDTNPTLHPGALASKPGHRVEDVPKKSQAELEQEEAQRKFKAEVREVARKIDPRSLVIDGVGTYTFERLLPNDLDVTFRSLTQKEERSINRDVRLYIEGKRVIGGEDFVKGEVPGYMEQASYRAARELAVLIDRVGPNNVAMQERKVFYGAPLEDNMKFLTEDLPSVLVMYIYGKSQVFLAAVARALVPETPEEERAALGKS